MDPVFQHKVYLLKRQVLALTGTFRIFGPTGELLLYSRQKMFRLKEDIRVFSDEASTRQVLQINARQMIDFNAVYDVTDSSTGMAVGALQRKGWRSLARDEWHFFAPDGRVLGMLQEDSLNRALLRRFLLGSFLPLMYTLTSGDPAQSVNSAASNVTSPNALGTLRQNFNLLRYETVLELSGFSNQIDPRLVIAAMILLAAIEGRQTSD
jgi:hypothetical protein